MRGLKFLGPEPGLSERRRTPHGVRGLKCTVGGAQGRIVRRTPHGVRGLKSLCSASVTTARRRTPHGVRGLK